MSEQSNALMPVLYLPHGGGPLPLLGDPGHEKLVEFLQTVPEKLGSPSAIVLVSAHWEESQVGITSAPQPQLIYDYYGFAEESYAITYAADGNPDLARKIQMLLSDVEIESELQPERGFDHGMFVPMKLMYPDADIPCVQVSLLQSMDAQAHVNIGKALAPLRQENILIIGSGSSYHNMLEFKTPTEEGRNLNTDFDFWLIDTCTSARYESDEREEMLVNWKDAPGAKHSHPREEHLLPVHVCLGAALDFSHGAELIYNEDLFDRRVSAFLWK